MQKPRVTKRKQQAMKTKKKIYDVSLKLFRKHGFETITIEDISKKAGVSVGAFYHYFASKTEILNEIFYEGDEYFKTVVAENLKDGTTAEKVIKFFEYYADFDANNGLDFMRQLINAQSKLFTQHDRPMHILLTEILKGGQERGEITQSMTAEDIMQFLFILARGTLYEWCLYDGNYDLKGSIVKNMGLALKSLKP